MLGRGVPPSEPLLVPIVFELDAAQSETLDAALDALAGGWPRDRAIRRTRLSYRRDAGRLSLVARRGAARIRRRRFPVRSRTTRATARIIGSVCGLRSRAIRSCAPASASRSSRCACWWSSSASAAIRCIVRTDARRSCDSKRRRSAGSSSARDARRPHPCGPDCFR